MQRQWSGGGTARGRGSAQGWVVCGCSRQVGAGSPGERSRLRGNGGYALARTMAEKRRGTLVKPFTILWGDDKDNRESAFPTLRNVEGFHVSMRLGPWAAAFSTELAETRLCGTNAR